METSGYVESFTAALVVFCVGGRVPTEHKLPAKSQCCGIFTDTKAFQYCSILFYFNVALDKCKTNISYL